MVELEARRRDPGSPTDELGHGLVRSTVRLLGEQPDGGRGRCGAHHARFRDDVSSEDPQKGGLAGAVGPDHADALAR